MGVKIVSLYLDKQGKGSVLNGFIHEQILAKISSLCEERVRGAIYLMVSQNVASSMVPSRKTIYLAITINEVRGLDLISRLFFVFIQRLKLISLSLPLIKNGKGLSSSSTERISLKKQTDNWEKSYTSATRLSKIRKS